MKRKLILFNILFFCVFSFSCSDDISSEDKIEWSSEYNDVYLTSINGVKTLCCTNYDTKNLRKVFKTFTQEEEDNFFINTCFPDGYIIFGVNDCYSTRAKKLDYYDLIDYPWNVYSIVNKIDSYQYFLGVEDFFWDLKFNDTGNFESTYKLQQSLGGIKNSYGFNLFKIEENDENLYLKLLFFDTKKDSNSYGDNFKLLTIDDIVLKCEVIFHYLPLEDVFILYP